MQRHAMLAEVIVGRLVGLVAVIVLVGCAHRSRYQCECKCDEFDNCWNEGRDCPTVTSRYVNDDDYTVCSQDDCSEGVAAVGAAAIATGVVIAHSDQDLGGGGSVSTEQSSSGSPQASTSGGITASGFTIGGAGARCEPGMALLFGGPGHRVFLGCLTCDRTDPNSVLNPMGPHGSELSENSIFNRMSPYGSTMSNYSACNPQASDPPVIVTCEGEAHGRLTLNLTRPDAPRGQSLATLRAVCTH